MPFATSLVANIPPPPFRGEDGATGIELGPLDLRMYGVMIAVGAYVGLLVAVRRYRDMGGDPELAERTALLAVAAAIVGSRIGFVIPRLGDFVSRPLEIVAIWRGGLAFFGGLALAVPAAWWYARRRGAAVPSMIDAFAPALPLGHAIGRWGNYFNQELYGRPTELPWALQVEPHHRVSGFEQFETFHPTFLYESLWNLALAGLIVMAGRRRIAGQRWLRPGSLGFLYLVGYGLGRFWIEWLRIDVPDTYVGLSRNSWNALLILVVGVIGLVWWQRRSSAAQEPAGDEAGTQRAAADADTPPTPRPAGRSPNAGDDDHSSDDTDRRRDR